MHNLVTDKKDKTFLDKINLTAKQILGIEEKAEKLYEIIETNGPVSLPLNTFWNTGDLLSVGAAIEHICLSATDLGLGSSKVAYF